MNAHEETMIQTNTGLEQELSNLQVKPRNTLEPVNFNPEKIRIAIIKAFKADLGIDPEAEGAIPERLANAANLISQHVVNALVERNANQRPIDIESIQDQVEIALMRFGHHTVARKYIIFREERAQLRKHEQESQACVSVKLDNGTTIGYDKKAILQKIKEACNGVKDVEATAIYDDVIRNLYDGLTQDELFKLLVMSARTLIEKEPNYSKVAARLLLQEHYHKVCEFLGIIPVRNNMQLKLSYSTIFQQGIRRGVEVDMISPKLLEFDLEFLGKHRCRA